MGYCRRCQVRSSKYDSGILCPDCQEEILEELERIKTPLLDVNELAELLRMSEEHVRRLERDGKIPRRVSGLTECRWHRDFIEEWLKRGAMAPQQIEKLDALLKLHEDFLCLNVTTGRYKLSTPDVSQDNVCVPMELDVLLMCYFDEMRRARNCQIDQHQLSELCDTFQEEIVYLALPLHEATEYLKMRRKCESFFKCLDEFLPKLVEQISQSIEIEMKSSQN